MECSFCSFMLFCIIWVIPSALTHSDQTRGFGRIQLSEKMLVSQYLNIRSDKYSQSKKTGRALKINQIVWKKIVGKKIWKTT